MFPKEIEMVEIEIVLPEIWKFEYWPKSKWIAFFGIFGLPQIRCMDQKKILSFQLFSTKKQFLMETLFGRIIPAVVTGMYEFDYRDKLIKLNNFWNFWLSGFWRNDQKYGCFNRTILHKFPSFDWDFCGRNQGYSCWDVSVWISIKIIISSTFRKFITIRFLMVWKNSILLQ